MLCACKCLYIRYNYILSVSLLLIDHTVQHIIIGIDSESKCRTHVKAILYIHITIGVFMHNNLSSKKVRHLSYIIFCWNLHSKMCRWASSSHRYLSSFLYHSLICRGRSTNILDLAKKSVDMTSIVVHKAHLACRACPGISVNTANLVVEMISLCLQYRIPLFSHCCVYYA